MSKFILLALFYIMTVSFVEGQGFNMVKKSQTFIPNQLYTDIWGYERDNGQKFAVVGTRQLTLIYNVTDCGNPVQVFQHNDGFSSIWRDYKTYGNAIYGTADQSPYNQGLQIINMDTYTVTNISTHFAKAHNIYVDTANARLYVAGSNTVSRGLIVYDVSNPLTPVHLANIQIDVLVNAPGLNTYVHDVYVKDNIAYTSNGYISKMYQLDVSNLNDVEVIAAYTGPSGYNHSGWTTDDGTFVYEALEVPKGLPINIYRRNQTNQNMLEKIGEFKDPLEFPVSSTNRPHNPFVHEDKLYISYYEDGVQVYDVSDGDNPTRIAYYDTYPNNNGAGYGTNSTFNGCWGVYPFMSHGCILANDIENGFYTLELDLPDPNSHSTVTMNQDLFQGIAGRGLVLRSPKGYCYHVGANSSGNFTTTRIVCQSNSVEESYINKSDISFITGKSIVAKNSNGNCYKMGLSTLNQITSSSITCPQPTDPGVKTNNTNLIINTYTKGIILYNTFLSNCVRITVRDDGSFIVTNLSACP
jgi:choice-of-anchor B domain-containing protein